MNHMLIGAIATGSLVAGLIFFRFWRSSRDRFFLYFALSFWIEAANRFTLGLMIDSNEAAPGIYLVRLLSYGLILMGILQKNRAAR